MNAIVEQALVSKIRTLSPRQLADVDDFVEFLAARSKKSAALDRLLAIVPALEAAGAEPMSEDEVAAEIKAEIKASRAERRGRQAAKRQRALRHYVHSWYRLQPLHKVDDAARNLNAYSFSGCPKTCGIFLVTGR